MFLIAPPSLHRPSLISLCIIAAGISTEPLYAREPLANICYLVTSSAAAKPRSQNFEYEYEKRIYEASMADYQKDNDQEIAKKISTMFEQNRDKLQCRGVDFDVIEGNVLKYAMGTRTFGFLDMAIDEWKVNLNWIDKDGTTLLDYAAMQVAKTKGTSNEQVMKNYYGRIRKAGGKHRRELIM